MAVAPSVATYEVVSGMCTATPKTAFVLGDQVCARVTPTLFESPAKFSLTWHNPASYVTQRTDLDTSDEASFIIPTDETSVFGSEVIDNRGNWKVEIVPAYRSVVRAVAYFTVSGATPTHDLNVYTSADTSEGNVPADTDLTVRTLVTNVGPDDAATVTFTQEVPANATFVSQSGGSCVNPSPGGTGTSTCDIASLPQGTTAEYEFVYHINSGAPKGTLIASLAQASTLTGELSTLDNQWTARATVTENPGAPVCAVGCPSNMTVAANTVDGGNNPGAVVNFVNDIESSGTCGTVSSTPASGTFFSVAGSPHTVSVSSTQGGGSCTFTINVTSDPAPTITCEADQNASVSGGSNEANVTVNPPTATGTNVQTTGVRNDNRAISDPYPVGTTTITWTAKECNDPPLCEDSFARTASCTQRIIVASPDAPTISCGANLAFNTSSGCDKTLTAADVPAPPATGVNVTVTGRRSDNLDLYDDPYPAGQTTITWTATECLDSPACTDPDARSVSCQQVITITSSGTDNTAPTLNVPANLSIETTACQELLDDELGVATAEDECSTVSISRTGVPTFPCPIPGNPGRVCESFIFPTGTTTITYTATDAAGNVTTGQQLVTVHESTPPTIAAPADLLNLNTGGAGGTTCGTFVGDATLGSATANDNCPDVTVTRTGVPAGNNFPVGDTVITYTATDRSGNTAQALQTVRIADNTPPAISCPSNITVYLPPNSTDTSMAVNYTAPVGTDHCAGALTTQQAGLASGSVFPVGTTTNTFRVTDAAGNYAECSFTVTVLYNFTGFFSPVGNVPTLNSVNAGRAIPIKFSLSGNKGLDIFAPNNPYTVSFNCATNDPGVDVAETSSAGGSSLSYSPDTYVYTWKTESSWAGTCRQLVVTLNDGSVHVANFKFR